MNAYQKSKQQEVRMERLKERREKLCELLQAERDQLEVKCNEFITFLYSQCKHSSILYSGWV